MWKLAPPLTEGTDSSRRDKFKRVSAVFQCNWGNLGEGKLSP